MKSFLLILLALFVSDPKEIAKINSLKKEAEQAYLAGDYELAIEKYSYLTDSMGIDEDEIKLNLAHSYYHNGDTTGAKTFYGKVGNSTDNQLRSIAYQQMGVMSKEANKLERALQQLKSAIKADPANRDAIYDYEVVKKLLEEQKKQEQQQQDQQNQDQNEEKKDGEDQNDQQNQDQKKDGEKDQNEEKKDGENQEQDQEQKEQDQENQEKKEGEQEEQEQQKSQEQMTKEKLEEMGISEEKARQLLEAMRQSEIKYLQNQKRKATKRPPSGKPDW